MSNNHHDAMSRKDHYCYIAVLLTLVLSYSGCGTGRTAGARGAQSGNLHEVIQLDTVIPLTQPIGAIDKVIIAGCAGTTYVYTKQDWASMNKIVLLRVQEQTGRVDTTTLIIPQDSAIDRRGTLADVAVDKGHIALLFWKALLVFTRENGASTISSPVIVPLNYSYKQVALVDGRCFVGMCNLSAREYGDHYTYALEVDPNSGKIKWEVPLPDPDGFQFTSFLPRRIMEFIDNGILVADLTRYRIVLYDSLGHSLETLTRHIADWENRYDSSFRRYRPLVGKVPYSMKSLLDTVRPYVSKMYMIRLVDAVDDSTIMIAWETPYKHDSGRLKGLEKVYYDMWRRRAGKWELYAEDLPDFNPQWTDSFAVERMFPLFWTYWSVGDSRIALLDPLPPINLQSKTYDEIRKAVDSSVIEGDPPFSLIYLGVSR